ncbi:TetR/AcrR family transcriptional regulator [Ferribacterium limneticum]|uniref:TetR/AcrR family transcriptional regulator n=1 Tax=Ferribacterium limneticum TaxID=76259 RepID=UPI001CFB0DD1|nr:TetR/AcrR family transcriptional regulator [Ferribacterium limneticum]UCV17802.1 TetR/AcrR family transcriptional regulator [Ferribacterium limneticum]
MKTKPVQNSRKARSTSERSVRLSPDQRRTQLLGWAINIFASRGFVAANHAAIATAAQVSVPTVFFYFKTREMLVSAVLEEVESFYQLTIAKAVDSDKPADVALLELTEALTNTLGSHADYARILREWSVSVHEPTWPRYLQHYRHMIQGFADVIARGQKEGNIRADLNAYDEAIIVYAGSTALIQMMEIGESSDRVDRVRRAFVQTVLLSRPSEPIAGSS